ncbi:mRNA-capping enzyme [Prorops nasuta]|uniref:mRNA-capping enzyme n=1 Tax=Prorops nasuta TaxID=863751 RepID=UPI0034CD2DC7
MSNRNENKGIIPPRWLNCPRKSVKLIQNKFLAFKTPLSSAFDSQIPEHCKFSIDMIFASLKNQKVKLGLWIDLTNTNRFYDKNCLEKYDCKYVKLSCRGHGETPSDEQTRTFVQLCRNFIAQNPLSIVGVHCTHGFNRTGFLIISYLVEIEGSSVDAALAEFANARPPGIYKADYLQELYRRYDDVEDAPNPPVQPAWCLEYDSSIEDKDEDDAEDEHNNDGLGQSRKRRKREFNNKNPTFMAGVPGVTPITDSLKLSGIRRRIQEICSWKDGGFPGSQPVSMDCDNIKYLHEKPYRVSWKADGTRYMMLIQGDGDIYFADRDNSIFQVNGLSFPHHDDATRCLRDTLLDGEMVIDKDRGKEYPRYLAYDVIMYDGTLVLKKNFFPDRYSIIEKKIIAGRHRALTEGRVQREREPFSVRLKQFWDITTSARLLDEKFTKMLSHEPDGLIFQPSEEPYTPGFSPLVLKWKPLSLNSVDLKLKIVTETGEGILPKKIGHLYAGGSNVPFGKMKMTKQIKDLNNAIIECKIENNQWVFMRERTDKSFPNSINTAQAVLKSIAKPITKDCLLDYINHHRFKPNDSELMPPPERVLR